MTRRARKFVGAVTMVIFVCVYALVTMAIVQGRVQDLPKLVQMLVYAVLGIGWIIPLMPLIRWMERPDEPR